MLDDPYRSAATALAESSPEETENRRCIHDPISWWQECRDCVEAFLRERFPPAPYLTETPMGEAQKG